MQRKLLNKEEAIRELSKHFLSAKLAMVRINKEDPISNKVPIKKLYKLFNDIDNNEYQVIRKVFMTIWRTLYKRRFLENDKERICQQITLILETGTVSSEIEELCCRGYNITVSWGTYGDNVRMLEK